MRDQYKNLCLSEPVMGEVRLRARSEVGLAYLHASVGGTRLGRVEQVDPEFICWRLRFAESSITTS